MTPRRFKAVTDNYSLLNIGVIGDFCLDRYLEIDPAKRETSLETGLEVYNVTNVRSNPGAAGTVLNNLCALGVKTIYPVAFCGEDGEGFELRRALARLPQVCLDYFFTSSLRRTFTYTKPLIVRPGKVPRELNRLDLKNWARTPASLETKLAHAVTSLAPQVDALIVLDQVDYPETGVVTRRILKTIKEVSVRRRDLIVLADSRRGLRDYPPLVFKMNRNELGALLGIRGQLNLEGVQKAAINLARKNQRPVFVSMAQDGIVGALPTGDVHRVASLPLRGEIDIVGAGDSVTANLACALTSKATLLEALQLAMAAASVVIHKLGTTGTASRGEIKKLI